MKTHNKNQISIIVPVYNVEQYLDRCVKSILSQTFIDFELILVNDGSPDNCPRICDEWANKDKRIHAIHQQNSGLSAARNAGIDWVFKNSKSQWLMFVDSDDWIFADTVFGLLEAAKQFDCDISVCGYHVTYGAEPEFFAEELCPSLRSPEDFFVNNRVNAIVAWGKLYKKDCFVNRRFPVGRLHEDEFLIPELLFFQQKIAVIPAPLYCYFRNHSGITGDKQRVYFDKLDALNRQLSYFRKNGFGKAERHILPLLADFIIRYFNNASEENKSDIRAARKMAKALLRKYKAVLSEKQKEQLSRSIET